ncbi:unnamed protein product [Protopolystoma xenopodis]|uniref:Uncharacterized protein n=1 Tax=Protopolystoma xenopodis TaxID=117903 RepID=A0A448XF50_9PLAT|nr:unnamed protein product [Protopolystoma xenopodis]
MIIYLFLILNKGVDISDSSARALIEETKAMHQALRDIALAVVNDSLNLPCHSNSVLGGAGDLAGEETSLAYPTSPGSPLIPQLQPMPPHSQPPLLPTTVALALPATSVSSTEVAAAAETGQSSGSAIPQIGWLGRLALPTE